MDFTKPKQAPLIPDWGAGGFLGSTTQSMLALMIVSELHTTSFPPQHTTTQLPQVIEASKPDTTPVLQNCREEFRITWLKPTVQGRSAHPPAFLAWSVKKPDVVWLSIRGPVSMTEFLAELDCFVPDSEGYHPGFRRTARDMLECHRNTISREVRMAQQACTSRDIHLPFLGVILTGHSLGGSLCTLLAPELALARIPVHAVITWGAPAVAGSIFLEHYNASLSGPEFRGTFRMVNRLDIIPRLPPHPEIVHVVEGIELEQWISTAAAQVANISTLLENPQTLLAVAKQQANRVLAANRLDSYWKNLETKIHGISLSQAVDYANTVTTALAKVTNGVSALTNTTFSAAGSTALPLNASSSSTVLSQIAPTMAASTLNWLSVATVAMSAANLSVSVGLWIHLNKRLNDIEASQANISDKVDKLNRDMDTGFRMLSSLVERGFADTLYEIQSLYVQIDTKTMDDAQARLTVFREEIAEGRGSMRAIYEEFLKFVNYATSDLARKSYPRALEKLLLAERFLQLCLYKAHKDSVDATRGKGDSTSADFQSVYQTRMEKFEAATVAYLLANEAPYEFRAILANRFLLLAGVQTPHPIKNGNPGTYQPITIDPSRVRAPTPSELMFEHFSCGLRSAAAHCLCPNKEKCASQPGCKGDFNSSAQSFGRALICATAACTHDSDPILKLVRGVCADFRRLAVEHSSAKQGDRKFACAKWKAEMVESLCRRSPEPRRAYGLLQCIVAVDPLDRDAGAVSKAWGALFGEGWVLDESPGWMRAVATIGAAAMLHPEAVRGEGEVMEMVHVATSRKWIPEKVPGSSNATPRIQLVSIGTEHVYVVFEGGSSIECFLLDGRHHKSIPTALANPNTLFVAIDGHMVVAKSKPYGPASSVVLSLIPPEGKEQVLTSLSQRLLVTVPAVALSANRATAYVVTKCQVAGINSSDKQVQYLDNPSKDANDWKNITFEERPTSISVTGAGVLLVGLESGKIVLVANNQPVRTFMVSPPAGPQNVTAPLGMKMSTDRQGNMVVLYGRTGEVFFATTSGHVVTTDVCHGEVLSVALGPMGHCFVVGADGVVLHRLSRFLLPPDIKPVDGFGPEIASA